MKSLKCKQVQARLLLLLEGELEPREAAGLNAHLRDCPRCEAFAEELSETQEQVEAALRTALPAPATLDARVMATVRRLPVRRMQWPAFAPPWSWQRRLSLAGAAFCLLLAGFVAGRAPLNFPISSPPDSSQTASVPTTASATPVLHMSSLRDHHLQSLTSPQAVSVMGNDPQQVAQRLGKEEECVAVPVRLSVSGAKLLGGRWHRVADVPVAFLCYEWNGRRISLYQTSGQRLSLPALDAIRQHQGTSDERCYVVKQQGDMTYVAWCSGTTNYILVAQATPEQLLHLARNADIVGNTA